MPLVAPSELVQRTAGWRSATYHRGAACVGDRSSVAAIPCCPAGAVLRDGGPRRPRRRGPRPLPSATAGGVRAEPAPQTAPRRPNIVFVLMDDFSMDLLPHDAQRARDGAARGVVRPTPSSWTRCAASRAARRSPGSTRTRPACAPTPPTCPTGPGRWAAGAAFARNGNQARTFAVRLQRSGYVTGYVGKYLNGYEIRARHQELPPVPPGGRTSGRSSARPTTGGTSRAPGRPTKGTAGDPQLAGAARVRTCARQRPVRTPAR